MTPEVQLNNIYKKIRSCLTDLAVDLVKSSWLMRDAYWEICMQNSEFWNVNVSGTHISQCALEVKCLTIILPMLVSQTAHHSCSIHALLGSTLASSFRENCKVIYHKFDLCMYILFYFLAATRIQFHLCFEPVMFSGSRTNHICIAVSL